MVDAAISSVADRFLSRQHRLLIGADWLPAADGSTFDFFDPSNGQRAGSVSKAGVEDVDRAVAAARQAFDQGSWRYMPVDARARLLWRFADLIEANAEELVELEIRTNGMPMAFARWGISSAASCLRHYAGMTNRIAGMNNSSVVSQAEARFHAYTVREPIGVAGLIIPWNGPIGSFVIKVAPALAAGCTCVVKPAEDTPVTALRLGELALEAGIPPGVLNILTGYGDVGAALVKHPGVDKISFTGSTETGKRVLRDAADTIKRVTLELGGKSPCIVFDDADMDIAIPGAAQAIFANTGQVCFAGSRLYVQRSSFDRIVAGVAEIAKTLKVGPGFDPSNRIGPVISEKQRKRICDFISIGEQEGGTIVAGGKAVDGNGYFVEPTVFTNVSHDARISREEIFGPVVIATPFDTIEEVVGLANDTNYGLGAGIFTNNLSRAHLVAEKLRAGNVWINTYGVMNPSMPFGGFKQSGLGREMGEEGLGSYLETKSVFIGL